ncbi:SCO7613 C-terminal domain-containing membrane protein [Streptomyces sp. NPDC057411]|uniref:SCO7613 C-terminal domain-containing membrane protein n=1 Tax=unclassified Streptomyces TaxID=2593676 RepID=UPI00363182CE
MDSSLPPAEELVLVDRELARLDAHRAQLLARRDWLLRVLHQPVAPPAVPRPEAAPRSAQNVLLTLGGVLLTVAAVAFTLVSWGSMGIGGRAAVLGAVTSAALLGPVALLRKGLRSTAESVAALGLVLTVLDAYALHRVALPDTGALSYTASAAAVLAAVWTAYGRALTGLRIPLPAAVAVAQLPLPLAVLAAGGGAPAIAWAALATAVPDLVVALRTKPAAPRIAAFVAAGLLGGWALLSGLALSAGTPLRAAPLLLACAAPLLYVAVRGLSAAALPSAILAGLSLIAAVGGLLRSVLPEAWAVPGYAVCAVALAALALRVRAAAAEGAQDAPWRPASAVRHGLAWAGGGVLGLALLWALPPVAAGLLGPPAREAAPWSGEHAEPLLTGYPATAPLVVLLAAGALAALPRGWARRGALALVWALLTALPVSLGLSYGPTLALLLLTAAAGLAGAVRPGLLTRGLPEAEASGEGVAWIAYAGGLVSAVDAVALGLDARAATFVVLGVLLALFVGVAVLAGGARRLVGACAAVLAAAGLVGAAAAAAHAGPAVSGLVLLVVPAGTVALGARLRRHPVAVAVEGAGAAVALCALGLTGGRPALLALALALGGVLAAATAVRPERRPVSSWVAAALFLLAAWVRLAVWEVTTPEAYTLPVTVPALVVGVLRRRRDPQASSWTAYGPGLAATLLPSLLAAWTDPGWLRPLLLGLGALVVTLLGARYRLQALLLLGGAVLALDGLHELAPYVVQVVGALPRWLPPALAGALLLAVGATYEQRLRDARRLRERLGRMR